MLFTCFLVPLPCTEMLSWSSALPLLSAEIVSLQSQRPSLKSKPWFRLSQILQITRLSHTLASQETGAAAGLPVCLSFPLNMTKEPFFSYLLSFFFFKFETGPHEVADAGLGYTVYSRLASDSILSSQLPNAQVWSTSYLCDAQLCGGHFRGRNQSEFLGFSS